MNRHPYPLYIVLILMVFTISCNDNSPTGPTQPGESNYQAFITGDLEGTLAGSAVYGFFTDPETDIPGILFELVSDDPTALRGIGFTGRIDGSLQTKNYSVIEFTSLLDDMGNPFFYLENETFVGIFVPGPDGEYSDAFASDEGVLEFVQLSDNRLVGNFNFSAYGYRFDDLTDTVWVNIEGEFEATRVDLQF